MECYVYQSLEGLRKAYKRIGGVIDWIEYWDENIRRVWIKAEDKYYCEFATTQVTSQLHEKEAING